MWPPQVQFARLLTIILSSGACVALAAIVLFLHAIFILWVALGAMFTRSRPVLRWLHIGSLCWGVLAELLPGTCPLTYLENWFESRAGIQPYQGGFLLHYLDKLVYPDISGTLLMIVAVIICSANLTFYALLWRLERWFFRGTLLIAPAEFQPIQSWMFVTESVVEQVQPHRPLGRI
jgi:hypothetical protein